MPITTARLTLAFSAAALAAGVAFAVPALRSEPAQAAPPAGVTASGTINGNGTIRHQKNLAAASRATRGVYCVRARKSDITRTSPVGTAANFGRVVSIIAAAHPQCGNRTDTYRVTVYNSATEQTIDGLFHIVVP